MSSLRTTMPWRPMSSFLSGSTACFKFLDHLLEARLPAYDGSSLQAQMTTAARVASLACFLDNASDPYLGSVPWGDTYLSIYLALLGTWERRTAANVETSRWQKCLPRLLVYLEQRTTLGGGGYWPKEDVLITSTPSKAAKNNRMRRGRALPLSLLSITKWLHVFIQRLRQRRPLTIEPL
ncbi:hypothetical protein LZ31DRAFT_393286 [Colletotrichum somersetense]|nr:hypothetical protein LZ31DRAFT_393286 [Colletotrichum somersetense]